MEARTDERLPALPYELDLSCPISLPTRPVSEPAWPFPSAGPSMQTVEDMKTFFQSRYLETLYLSDVLSPMSSFIADFRRMRRAEDGKTLQEAVFALIRGLPYLERKHRRQLRPFISAIVNAEVGSAAQSDPTPPADLDQAEVDVLRIGFKLRMECRAVADGGRLLEARKLAEELERREILLQVVLHFLLRGCGMANWDMTTKEQLAPTHWRKRKHKTREDRKDQRRAKRARAAGEGIYEPEKHPAAIFELLLDRMSIWHAVTEFDLGSYGPAVKPDEDDGSVCSILFHFWWDVIRTNFLRNQWELCTIFHKKLFGSPIPDDIWRLPYSSGRGGRVLVHMDGLILNNDLYRPKEKPAPTRPQLPARLPQPSAPSSSSFTRAPSRALSEATSRASPPPGAEMRRSMSRTSETQVRGHKRDRSLSTDLPRESLASIAANAEQRQIRRAPSAKELFKGREVTLISRSRSFAIRKEKEAAREESQKMGGLLGRKAQDQAKRRLSGGESQARSETAPKAPALVMATPSKPKQPNSMFGPRPYGGHALPTPIQEEPSSVERAAWVAETPVNPHRIAHTMPPSAMMPFAEEEDEAGGDESDDPLGELMVMTDDEDGDVSGQSHVVPETPAK